MYSFATFVCTITSTLKFNAFIILPVVLFVHWHNDHYCNKTSLIEHTVYTTWQRDCFSCACWRRLTMPCTRPCRPRSWPTQSRPRASTRSTSTSCTSVCCGHTCDVMKYESVLEFITKKKQSKDSSYFCCKMSCSVLIPDQCFKQKGLHDQPSFRASRVLIRLCFRFWNSDFGLK